MPPLLLLWNPPGKEVLRVFNTIASVDPGSPLDGKVSPGDQLIFVNSHPIRDVLDYKYYSSDARLTVEYTRAGKIRFARVVKEEGLPLGLEFESYLMDKARACFAQHRRRGRRHAAAVCHAHHHDGLA